MARKYKVTEIEGFASGVSGSPPMRVFDVKWDDGSPYLDFAYATIWFDPDPDWGSVRCTVCSTPLVAMSAGCPHVAAVKRFLKKETALRAREITKAIE